MGLLDDYGVDPADYDSPSFEVEDGTYPFQVTNLYRREGTQNHPDDVWIILEYNLEMADETTKKYSEWFKLPADPNNIQPKEGQVLGRYKDRLISLGLEREQIKDADADTVAGISGVLTLVTTKGRNGGEFQNVRRLTVDDGESAAPQPVDDAPAPAAQPKTEAKAAPAAKAKATVTPPASVVANPFG